MTALPRRWLLVGFSALLFVLTVIGIWMQWIPGPCGVQHGGGVAAAILASEAWLGCVALVAFWFRGIYALCRAVANRAAGIGPFEAMNCLSLLFVTDNYTSEGLRWVRTYRRSVLGFIVSFFACPCVVALTFLVFSSFGFEIPSDLPTAQVDRPE